MITHLFNSPLLPWLLLCSSRCRRRIAIGAFPKFTPLRSPSVFPILAIPPISTIPPSPPVLHLPIAALMRSVIPHIRPSALLPSSSRRGILVVGIFGGFPLLTGRIEGLRGG